MKVLDLFAGIGGFTLGLERVGFETVAFCEIDAYAQKVLKKNWPEVPIYDDVRKITAERLASDGIRVDVITGGFPCQDISTAGRQAGIEGERSGLWSECARLLGEIRPRYAIFENVTNLLNGDGGDWFKRVLGDISALGYDAEWHCIPASAIGAHHHRDRVWIVAYPKSAGSETCGPDGLGNDDRSRRDEGQFTGAGEQKTVLLENSSCIQRISGSEEQGVLREMQEDRAVFNQSCGRGEAHGKLLADTNEFRLEKHGHGKPEHTIQGREDMAHTSRERLQGGEKTGNNGKNGEEPRNQLLTRLGGVQGRVWETEPHVGRVANGVPSRSHRLKCLGNAVVPQIPELIGYAIKSHLA